MQKGLILQVRGLGVLIQHPCESISAGFELRWSSDPETSPDSPAHVLLGDEQLKRFLHVGLAQSYITKKMVSIIPVSVGDDKNSLSKAECLKIGLEADNWEMVRTPLSVSGHTSEGPVIATKAWWGSRDEFSSNEHISHAMSYGQNLGMRRPVILSDKERGQLLNAADFFESYRKEMRPSLRAADLIMQGTEEALMAVDVDRISPEQAKHYLRNIQTAFEGLREQRLQQFNLVGLGDALSAQQAKEKVDALDSASQGAIPNAQSKSRGPRLH